MGYGMACENVMELATIAKNPLYFYDELYHCAVVAMQLNCCYEVREDGRGNKMSDYMDENMIY